MRQMGPFITIVFVFLLVVTPVAMAADGVEETPYYSDRFVFQGGEVDDLVLVILNFNRGQVGPKPYGEFFGALFHKGRWSYLEGNDLYPYRAGDLRNIQSSYYARVTGAAASGFKLRYDGGDHTFDLACAPMRTLDTSHVGPTLKSSVSSAEAWLRVRGNVYWGRMIHEPLVWTGFHGLKKYRGLFEAYHRFYLTTAAGREVYFYQNKSDRVKFLSQYDLVDTFQPEGGVMVTAGGVIDRFPQPIALRIVLMARSFLSFFPVPERWEVDASPLGTFSLWSRGQAEKGWFLGGYHLIAIEGILKTGAAEERVWGLAEYIP